MDKPTGNHVAAAFGCVKSQAALAEELTRSEWTPEWTQAIDSRIKEIEADLSYIKKLAQRLRGA